MCSNIWYYDIRIQKRHETEVRYIWIVAHMYIWIYIYVSYVSRETLKSVKRWQGSKDAEKKTAAEGRKNRQEQTEGGDKKRGKGKEKGKGIRSEGRGRRRLDTETEDIKGDEGKIWAWMIRSNLYITLAYYVIFSACTNTSYIFHNISICSILILFI